MKVSAEHLMVSFVWMLHGNGDCYWVRFLLIASGTCPSANEI